MTERFLTTDEVAKMLQLNVQKIRKLVRNGELPGIFTGKSYRIPESELLRWMDQHKIRRR